MENHFRCSFLREKAPSCTDLQRAGVAINIAKELMGHSSIAVTADIYTHRDSNVLHENISRLDTPTTNQVLKMGENWWGN